jgi:solute carrier family 35 protein F5
MTMETQDHDSDTTTTSIHNTPSATLSTEDLHESLTSFTTISKSQQLATAKWRHTLGIILLLITVLLWTTSSFLASTIFADNTFSKPFFVTYINSSFFAIPLIPILLKRYREDPTEIDGLIRQIRAWFSTYEPLPEEEQLREVLSKDDDLGPLTLAETARLSAEFSLLWFSANYFAVACLEYTTVGSATILTSTSSVWTLLAGTLVGVERFSLKKLLGVTASLVGVVLISTIDLSSDEDRGSFPFKTPKEIAIGDTLAFISAVIYGIYAVFLKSKIGNELRIDMRIFFGFVGVLNILTTWPFFILLSLLNIESFALPPTSRVLIIVLFNSASSLVSDFCWAYAMLLTSPLIVTVGLSLTIPLSLVVQIVLQGSYAGWAYWVGALIVVTSFAFINHEGKVEEETEVLGNSIIIRENAEGEC